MPILVLCSPLPEHFNPTPVGGAASRVSLRGPEGAAGPGVSGQSPVAEKRGSLKFGRSLGVGAQENEEGVRSGKDVA